VPKNGANLKIILRGRSSRDRGSNPPGLSKIKTMVLYWTGTDSLMLVDVSKRSFRKKVVWIIFRPIIWFLDRFYVERHYVDHDRLAENLRKFGVTKPIEEKRDAIKYTWYCGRNLDENKFRVLFYMPRSDKFAKWLYGYDIFKNLKKAFREDKDIEFVMVLGKDRDMSQVFPGINMYIRPNRHDGASRLVQECEVQGIPVVRTYREETSTYDRTTYFIEKINEEYIEQGYGQNE